MSAPTTIPVPQTPVAPVLAHSSVMVQNNHPGPTVFSTGGYHIEWQGRGDEMGRDLQAVPESFLHTVDFHRVLECGILTIETDEQKRARAIGLHRQDFEDRMEGQRTASLASMDAAPDNDSLVIGCIGPAGNGRDLCGTPMPVKVKAQGDKPPLCPVHIGLANQFVSDEGSGRMIGGKAEIVWRRIQIDTRTQQQR